jgi:hypothetical protein
MKNPLRTLFAAGLAVAAGHVAVHAQNLSIP